MRIKTTRDCKRYLFNYNQDLICSCGNEFFYKVSDFGRVCAKCRKKYSAINGTMFCNVRFGLLKAFRIVFKEYNNDFTSSSVEVSKEFKISQKTAWKFLNKIRSNADVVIDLVEFVDNSQQNLIKPLSQISKYEKSQINKIDKHFDEVEKLKNKSNLSF